jgi:hypothetical protein
VTAEPPSPESAARRAEALLRAAEAAAAAASVAGGAMRAELDASRTQPATAAPQGTTSVGRLLALAEDLAAQAHDARARLDALDGTLARLSDELAERAEPERPLTHTPPTAADAQRATARLVAVEMALAGAAREEVAEVLDRAFGLADDDALLDDVLGPA